LFPPKVINQKVFDLQDGRISLMSELLGVNACINIATRGVKEFSDDFSLRDYTRVKYSKRENRKLVFTRMNDEGPSGVEWERLLQKYE
jgi:hypothetical protein